MNNKQEYPKSNRTSRLSVSFGSNKSPDEREVSSLKYLLTQSSAVVSTRRSVQDILIMKPVTKEQITYSDQIKVQAQIIKKLVEEQELETMERKRTQAKCASESSETFATTMKYIEEQMNREKALVGSLDESIWKQEILLEINKK